MNAHNTILTRVFSPERCAKMMRFSSASHEKNEKNETYLYLISLSRDFVECARDTYQKENSFLFLLLMLWMWSYFNTSKKNGTPLHQPWVFYAHNSHYLRVQLSFSMTRIKRYGFLIKKKNEIYNNSNNGV